MRCGDSLVANDIVIPGADGPYPLGREPRVVMGRTRAPRILATKDDIEAAREPEMATMGEKARRSIERSYAAMPLAKYLPCTRDLLVDAADNLWVQHYPLPEEIREPWVQARLDVTPALVTLFHVERA
jgi:hypothetical protein